VNCCRMPSLSLALVAVICLSPLSPPPATAAADGCSPGSASDFNGDGFADAVVADSTATVSGRANAGRLVVFYGDSDGRIGEGARRVVQQGSGTVSDAPETGDRFGFALAAADLDCDDFTDLVVGSPYEDVGGADSGLVQIVWGASTGLGTGRASTTLSPATFGNTAHAGDEFGYAVDALEDVGQGGTGAPSAYALAIGAPGWDVGSQQDAGWVGFQVAYDGDNVEVEVTQDSPGIPGAAESGDRFGAAVSLGDLLGDRGTVDAAVGTPNEDIGNRADAGAMTIVRDLYFDPDGVAYDQNSQGVPGAVEPGDRFGQTLDSVQVGLTSRLAVGVPGEDIGSATDAGSVQLFSGNGASLTPGVGLSQNTAGVTGVAESGDLFGDRLVFAPPGLGDPVTRLAVSAPRENGSRADSGLVQVFPVTDLDAETTWSQDSIGVPGGVDAGDRFGAALAFVSGQAERALIVGVPDDVDNPNGMVNVIGIRNGGHRSWVPGVGGVPSGGSRFGDSLASAGNSGV
jgi:hypothetical protein